MNPYLSVISLASSIGTLAAPAGFYKVGTVLIPKLKEVTDAIKTLKDLKNRKQPTEPKAPVIPIRPNNQPATIGDLENLYKKIIEDLHQVNSSPCSDDSQ